MKNLAISGILSIAFIASNSVAQTADIKTAVYQCDGKDYSLHAKVKNSSLSDRTEWSSKNSEESIFPSSSKARPNLSQEKCLEQDLSSWMSSLKNQCMTYFNVISMTPLNRGYSEYLYKDEYNAADEDHSGGYGYSYTDRLVLLYHCL